MYATTDLESAFAISLCKFQLPFKLRNIKLRIKNTLNENASIS